MSLNFFLFSIMFCFLNWPEQTHIKEYLLMWQGHIFFCKHTHRPTDYETKVSYKTFFTLLAHQACGTSGGTHQVTTAAPSNQTCRCVFCLQSPLQTPSQTWMSFSTANQAHTRLTWPPSCSVCCRQCTKRITEVWEGLTVTRVPN